MKTGKTTSAELITAIIAAGEYATDAAIARESGRSAQTIHRWHTGKVNVGQDDMADLLVDLGLEPSAWNVEPSREWQRRHADRFDTPTLPMPEWFESFARSQAMMLEAIDAKLAELLARH